MSGDVIPLKTPKATFAFDHVFAVTGFTILADLARERPPSIRIEPRIRALLGMAEG